MSDPTVRDEDEMIENLEMLMNLDTLEEAELWDDLLNEKFND